MEMNEDIATNSKLEVFKLSASDLSDMLFELVEREYLNYVRELFANDHVVLCDDLASGKGIFPSDYIQNLAKAAMLAGDVRITLEDVICSKRE